MSFSRAEIDALYRQYGPSVLRRARAILGNEAAAKDALQEVFIRAIRAGDGFRGEASPMTWLYRVTTNLCLNQLRDHARRAELLAENAPPPGEGAVVPGHDERLTVARVLARLPEELREIAVYYFVDQMNQDEIAEIVGVSRHTVGNRLEEFRALARAATGEGVVGSVAP